MLSGGKEAKLLSNVMDADQALFVEQEVANHLGIEGRHVRGQMGS